MDDPQISTISHSCVFWYFNCLHKLKKNWFGGSLAIFGASCFGLLIVRVFLSFHCKQKQGTLLEKNSRRRPRKQHRGLSRFLWGQGVQNTSSFRLFSHLGWRSFYILGFGVIFDGSRIDLGVIWTILNFLGIWGNPDKSCKVGRGDSGRMHAFQKTCTSPFKKRFPGIAWMIACRSKCATIRISSSLAQLFGCVIFIALPLWWRVAPTVAPWNVRAFLFENFNGCVFLCFSWFFKRCLGFFLYILKFFMVFLGLYFS